MQLSPFYLPLCPFVIIFLMQNNWNKLFSIINPFLFAFFRCSWLRFINQLLKQQLRVSYLMAFRIFMDICCYLALPLSPAPLSLTHSIAFYSIQFYSIHFVYSYLFITIRTFWLTFVLLTIFCFSTHHSTWIYFDN